MPPADSSGSAAHPIRPDRVDKNAPVNDYRFLNRSQPQTLVNATILCYIEAFFGLIDSGGLLVFVVVAAGLGAGGFGIANDKRWGYGVAVGAAVLHVGLWLRLLRRRRARLPAGHLVRVRGAARRAARCTRRAATTSASGSPSAAAHRSAGITSAANRRSVSSDG